LLIEEELKCLTTIEDPSSVNCVISFTTPILDQSGKQSEESSISGCITPIKPGELQEFSVELATFFKARG
jgi:hypothetical protein